MPVSDDQVVERWAQDILFQFFSGQDYFEHRLPCDSSLISRFRKDLGEGGVEELLKTTIETAVAIAAVKKTDLQRVIVDTTVAEKAIAHPTDSRLLDVARKKLVRLAQRSGIGPGVQFQLTVQKIPHIVENVPTKFGILGEPTPTTSFQN